MADLKAGPTDVKQSWEDGVIEILIGYGLASKRPEDGQKSKQNNDKPKKVPWCSLA